MSFLDELEKDNNKVLTENGAITNRSTLDPLLDYFSLAGAMRNDPASAHKLFKKAFAADKLNAIKCLFYLRDVRGGQGERAVFYETLKNLDEDTAIKIIKYIPEYGRYDDFEHLQWTPRVLKALAAYIKEQLVADERSMAEKESVTLLAKWLPSENAGTQSRKLARKLYKALKFSPEFYRTRTVALRNYYDNFLEHLMSENRWSEIDYAKLPSQAHKKHIKAFKRHDEARYNAYLESVKKGEAKINAGTLMTYEIYDMVDRGENVDAADALWNALPDYTQGKSALCVVDTSGSMEGLSWIGIRRTVAPMSVGLSLALYFAERNKGAFHNYFMTFSDRSDLVKISGETLEDKFDSMKHIDVGGSTNIQAAFDSILRAAVAAKAPADEVPAVLYIMSDMEFNVCTRGNQETNFEAAKRKFNEAGYELPHVVFWNLEARHGGQAPATKHDKNVTMISGFNQSTFRYIVEGKSPLESMMEVLGSERYAQIEV